MLIILTIRKYSKITNNYSGAGTKPVGGGESCAKPGYWLRIGESFWGRIKKAVNTSLTLVISRQKYYKSIVAYLLLSYASFISLISLLVRVQRISMRAISSQPEPFMALFSCWHKYSTGGDIRPRITSSNLPPSSLFKSFTKSCQITIMVYNFINILIS